jgi:hypothetical protein
MGEELRVIRASEIGEYGYCSRAWWYRHVIKVTPPGANEQEVRLAQGREAHARHGRSVSAAVTLRLAGIAIMLCGLALLAIIVVLNLVR